MMDYPLCLTMILNRAERYFPNQEIVSRNLLGDIYRYNYKYFAERVRRLSDALQTLGVERGDRVATFAWNNHRHLEAYFAIPCMGAVLHTVNIRLHSDDLVYIINHAGDKVLLVDEDLLPIIEGIRDRLTSLEAYIVMTDDFDLSTTTLSPVHVYETLLAEANKSFIYPSDLDENSPLGICYTSGTTGKPKGVVYTHRSTLLHTLSEGLADSSALSGRDAVLPIVPMFHVNAWGFPYSSAMFGCKLVLPGNGMSPPQIADLMEAEEVTFAAGVPTVWLGLARELVRQPRKLKVRELVSGGAPMPESLIRTFYETFGIPIVQGYGMTETSPIVLLSRLRQEEETLTDDKRYSIMARQGYPVPGVEVRVVGHDGDVPWDDETMGEIWMRGPWIADTYNGTAFDASDMDDGAFRDGWLHSGDVATVNARGSLRIVDRTRDLVKSGGEWISSVELENAMMGHPNVFEAAVVAIPHQTWGERPLAVVVLKNADTTDDDMDRVRQELVHLLENRFAKWWVPDAFEFVDEIPKSTVGKLLKRAVRDQYRDYYRGN